MWLKEKPACLQTCSSYIQQSSLTGMMEKREPSCSDLWSFVKVTFRKETQSLISCCSGAFDPFWVWFFNRGLKPASGPQLIWAWDCCCRLNDSSKNNCLVNWYYISCSARLLCSMPVMLFCHDFTSFTIYAFKSMERHSSAVKPQSAAVSRWAAPPVQCLAQELQRCLLLCVLGLTFGYCALCWCTDLV